MPKVVNLMRSLCGFDWSADSDMMLHLYKSLIRSRLDYGAMVYNSAPHYLLKQLDSIVNDSLRISTGAFKTTAIASLQIIANEKPQGGANAEILLQDESIPQ